MKQYLVLYVLTLGVMAALDMLWIGGLARDFYKSRLGEMMEVHTVPAVLFYLSYAAGVVFFVLGYAPASVLATFLYGAFFGFIAYGTYDLTNLATLRGWSLSLCVVDLAWGTFVTGTASALVRVLARYVPGAA